jgi:hypothetical protein
MVYDVRTYDLHQGKVQEYMKAVREVGLPIRKAHGVKLAGWYYTVIGPITQVIHIWAYDSLAHLEKAKAEVEADPRWEREYLPRVRPLIASARDQIMMAADFAPQAR